LVAEKLGFRGLTPENLYFDAHPSASVRFGEFYLFDSTGFDPRGTPSLCVLHLAAWVIAIGALITCVTRLHAISAQLRAR
jgi:hypothetical protein